MNSCVEMVGESTPFILNLLTNCQGIQTLYVDEVFYYRVQC